ncbi:MAG: arginase family protein [Alphaproteobacteria bacterium]|nr:arginase family protein [Alphaproteobacteria bacterium]
MAAARINRPFVGIPSFLRAPLCTDPDDFGGAVAVMGVPFDEGSPFLAGSRMGPRALREHSLRFVSGEGGFYNPETRKSYLDVELRRGLILDAGDADIAPTNVERSFANVTDMARRLLERGALLVALGGDHSVTYPLVRAFTEPLHVVHFDAHSDYAPFIHDLRFTNAHAFRHIAPMAHVESLTQVGIRSLRHSPEMVEDSIRDGNRVVTMEEFRRVTPRGIAEIVPAGASCYVSIDVDVLDLSLIPGCVSAEPNGMSYAELRDTLKAIAERTNVIGFDFVEVNPELDVRTGVTSYLGAHTVIEFLGHICDQPRWAERRERQALRHGAK